MREIEFRGKWANKLWVMGLLVRQSAQLCSIVGIDVIPETVGEHTGLRDRNGAMIFEGDIVKSVNSKGVTVQLGVVEFCLDKKSFSYGGFGIRVADGRWGRFYQHSILGQDGEPLNWDTVIGNIHDNPELLKDVNK